MPDLEAAVKEQGEQVRSLKAAKADKATITAAVEKLLALKKELAAATGAAPPAPPAAKEKKEKKAKGAAAAPAAAAAAAPAAGAAAGSLDEFDAILQTQPFLCGFTPTSRDAEAFDEMFQGHRQVAEWAARMARYYPAERRRMLHMDAAPAAKKPAAKAAAPKAAAPAGGAAAPGGEKGEKATNFLRELIKTDLAPGGRCAHRSNKGDIVRTRFPPEPNGYLHVGHAKSICLNFGFAQEFGGRCHLRYDDTNPTSEKQEYIDAIEADVRWLGFNWGKHKYFASDYFDQLYEWALHMIRNGDAYIDSQTAEELRKGRGDLVTAGVNSPFRERSVEENLRIFGEMRDGKHPEGKHVLRAKIDMASPNMNMRDPLMYRVLHKEHPHTGNKWCIYPLYDFAHGQEDQIEGITHSFCTLEFDGHRPLYDWYLQHIPIDQKARPVQTEFNRLNITNCVLSKRKLKLLVDMGAVTGWDDPRMPSICGMRRRGITPEALRGFCDKVGASRTHTVIDQTSLDESIRDDLDQRCPRRYAVLDPIKLVITDYPEDKVEHFVVPNHPKHPMGDRKVPFCRELYIERTDYRDDPPADYFGLKPGGIALLLRCEKGVTVQEVVRDAAGQVTELRCTHEHLESKEQVKKYKGHLHWVSARHCITATARLFNTLLKLGDDDAQGSEDGGEEDAADKGKEFLRKVNPESQVVMKNVKLEPECAGARPAPIKAHGCDLSKTMSHFQFERNGFFAVDSRESTKDALVFNRTITLRPGGLRKAEDSDAVGRSRKEEQAKQAAAKAAMQNVDPKQMFRGDAAYSKFDADGIPTHDAEGKEIAKSQVKKLKAKQEKQAKLFSKAQKSAE